MASITIPLYYDLDLLLWTSAAGGIAPQPNLVLGQSDSIAFAVQFVRSGVVIELTAPQFICGIKPINDTAGDYLCQTTTVVKTGSTTTTVYTFTLLLDSIELQAWLLTVTAVTNYAAFSIRDTVNLIATLPAITCTILPDYTLTGATPAAASGTLVVDSGATFTVHKTFAMPTTNGTDTYILQTNGAGVGSWVAKAAGGVTSVAQSFTGGIVSVSGSPITTSGTLALTVAGTSGGLVYFSSTSAWASSAVMSAGALVVGGGAGATPTELAAVASGRVLTSAGTLTTPAYSSTITLGASGTLGTITLGNATSGTILITPPPTGALGTPTLTLPITSTTLAGLSVAQAFNAAQTFSSTVSLTLDTDASSSTAGGTLTVTGGAAVSRKLFVGSLLDLVATTATAGQITQAGTRLLHTYGTNNLFVGSAAGKTSGTIGSGNVSLGRDSLTSITSGSNNTCLGDQSGYFISSGSSNMLMGNSAGVGITIGSQNIAMGVAALRSIVGNGDCTAIGHQALYYATGQKNTGIGSNASWTCTSGSKNTFIGEYSGASTDTIGGLLGVGFTTGSNNTMLGQNTASTTAAGNYRTAIGSDSRCESNNAIKLGRDTLDVVLLPKMTQAQMATAATTLSTVKGAIVYCTDGGADADHVHFYNGTSWARIN
jgi:hypothetical protein